VGRVSQGSATAFEPRLTPALLRSEKMVLHPTTLIRPTATFSRSRGRRTTERRGRVLFGGRFDSLAPAHSALAGLWLRPMELPLLLSVSND